MERSISLDGAWNWNTVGKETVYQGKVPGTVLTDMVDGKLIEDPFWRTNEYKTRELLRKDYCYFRKFQVPEDFLKEEKQEMVFEGLDTIADIFLNEELLASTKDMHRTWRLDVKGKLKEENQIKVVFHSPIEYIEKAHEEGDIFYASTGCMQGNGSLRKAHYMFGWDWGPQLPDAGIFRSVYLLGASTARLTDVRIRQFHKNGAVTLEIEEKAERLDETVPITFFLRVTDPDGREVAAAKQILPEKEDQAVFHIEIENPRLWWPNGYGEQPLYQVEASLKTEEQTLDAMTKKIGEQTPDVMIKKIGLRTVTVCTDKDQWGNQFAFVVNGQKIFAMGANYIPEDNILGHLTPERSDALISSCARANFNCIRVWGGGYYPEDYFYDACDRYGILIWHDLMFACNVYDLNDEFEENILKETEDNVKRIRHHAVILF